MNWQKVLTLVNSIFQGINGPFKVAMVSILGGVYIVSTKGPKQLEIMFDHGLHHYLGAVTLSFTLGGFVLLFAGTFRERNKE